MSISLAKWHKTKRFKYRVALWPIRYRAWRNPRLWTRLRRWWRAIRLLGFAVVAGIALAFAADQYEHEPAVWETVLRPVDILRGSPNESSQQSHDAPRRPVVRGSSAAATVFDGDTLKLGSERIRLHGIDAPESQQRCADGWHAGQAVRRALADLVSPGAPRCERVTTDRCGRTVAVCRINGRDIGAAMVRSGHAWAYTQYSWRYVSEKTLARLEGVGVHARTCTQPAEWRAQHRRKDEGQV